MPRGNDFSNIDPTETVTVTWDFAPWLASGVTLSGPVTDCSLISGTDAAPASRLIGNPVVTISPSKQTASQAVFQQIQGMQPGAKYILLCTANTSDNQVLSLYAHEECDAPN